MNKETKKDLGIGIFFAVLSILYMIEALNISTFTPFGNRGLDSQSIPLMIGWLVLGLSAILIASSLLKGKRERAIAKTEAVAEMKSSVKGFSCPLLRALPLKLLLSLALLIVYFYFYQRLGFILSSAGYLIAQMFLLTQKGERKRWALFIVLFSIGLSIVIYILFVKYFTLFLPRGILG